MTRFGPVLALLALAAPVAAQQPSQAPNIADVDSISRGGTVTVRRGAQELRVTPRGNPMNPSGYLNKSLFDQDFVLTAAGSTAVVLFKDQTRLDLNQSTEIQILEANLREATPDGRTIGRRIRLLAGQIVSDVKPNAAIKTDFVTPSGSAAVRGTGLAITYNAETGVMQIGVTEGSVTIHHPSLGGQFGLTLEAGQSLQLQFDPNTGTLEISSVAGDAIGGYVGDQQIEVQPGSRLSVSVEEDQVQVEVDDGEVEMTDPTTGQTENLEAGESLDVDAVEGAEDPTQMEFALEEIPAETPTETPTDTSFDTAATDLMNEVVGDVMGDTFTDMTGDTGTTTVDGTLIGEQVGTEIGTVLEEPLPAPPQPPY